MTDLVSEKSIPLHWVQIYVDRLLQSANEMGPQTAMGQAMILRANHAMDLVEAWEKNTRGRPLVSHFRQGVGIPPPTP